MIALLCYGFIYYVFKHLGTPTAYATYILLLCRLALGMRRDFLQEGNLVRLSELSTCGKMLDMPSFMCADRNMTPEQLTESGSLALSDSTVVRIEVTDYTCNSGRTPEVRAASSPMLSPIGGVNLCAHS